MSTTAKIAAKGCNDTGITETLAKRLHDQLGKKVVAVVEIVAEARSEKRNGDESVALSILTLEPAPNGETEDYLRNLARAFHYERQLADGQLTLDSASDIEPKVKDVLAAGQGFLQELPDDADDDEGEEESDDNLEGKFGDELEDPEDDQDDDPEVTTLPNPAAGDPFVVPAG
jgi:hypothetical protein